MILLTILSVILVLLLLLICREYYKLYRQYDDEITAHSRCRERLHIVNDYLAYYEQCMTHGTMAMSLEEFIKLYHYVETN